jgi:hypothetical protein
VNVYVSFSRSQLSQLHMLVMMLRDSGQSAAAELTGEAHRALMTVVDEQERLERMIREKPA